MIANLNILAGQIAELREFAERARDTPFQKIAEDLAAQFTVALDELAECDGVLAGDMPWWGETAQRFNKRP